MNPYYQPFHKQARDLQFKFHDVLDNPSHPTANVIRNELRNLETDLETGKSPRTVENRIKTIQRQINQAHHMGDNIMSPDHTNYFHDNFEHMQMNIRKLPHY